MSTMEDKNLAKRRELFNIVKEHLLTQRAPAKNGDECVYLAEDGKRCALGILIKDTYTPDCEGDGMCWLAGGDVYKPRSSQPPFHARAALARACNLAGIPADETTKNMIQNLQYIHDCRSVEAWQAELGGLEASTFGVEV